MALADHPIFKDASLWLPIAGRMMFLHPDRDRNVFDTVDYKQTFGEFTVRMSRRNQPNPRAVRFYFMIENILNFHFHIQEYPFDAEFVSHRLFVNETREMLMANKIEKADAELFNGHTIEDAEYALVMIRLHI